VSDERANCPACSAPLPKESALQGVDRLHGVTGEFEVRVCPACGTGRTFPTASDDELGRFYPQSYGAYSLPGDPLSRALATALFRQQYRRALRRHPLGLLRSLPPGKLLDVGAGRGDLGVVLTERGWQVTGLEPSPEACAAGRRRGLAMVEGTLSTAVELAEGYDVVVFQHSLEHAAQPREMVTRARDLLRPGGALLVLVPNFGSWQARRFGNAWFHLDLPRHRSHFTPIGLERLLHQSGFEGVRLSTTTTADGLPVSLQYRLSGRRRFRTGAARYLWAALTIGVEPLTKLAGAVGGSGDELGASALRPSAS
jgi:SAM-dependent methyltransferase